MSTHDMVGNQGKSKSLITALMASGELSPDDGRIWDTIGLHPFMEVLDERAYKSDYIAIRDDLRFGEEFLRTWEIEQEQRRQDFARAVADAIARRVGEIIRPHMRHAGA